MSGDDVHPHEMNEPHDLDDTSADALISGHGQGIDPALADLVGDMRVAYSSQPPVLGAELTALIHPAPAPTPLASRRFERMRSSVIAKVGAATATLLAATGGLAVAHALPAPVQDAVSHLGIGASEHHHNAHAKVAGAITVDPTTVHPNATTVPVDTTTVEPHETTVPEETTVPGGTTPTTAEPIGGHHDNATGELHDSNGDANACGDHHDGKDSQDDSGDTITSTVPTTPGSTVRCAPTTETTTPQHSDGHGDGQDHTPTTTVTTVPNPNTGSGSGSGDHGNSHGGGGGDNGGGSNGGNQSRGSGSAGGN